MKDNKGLGILVGMSILLLVGVLIIVGALTNSVCEYAKSSPVAKGENHERI